MKPNDTANDTGRTFKRVAANLYKCEQNEVAIGYFMHAKIRGELVRRSLKTKNFEAAKIRLRDMHAKELARITRERELGAVGKGTVGELAAEYLRRDNDSQEIKQSTKDYHAECVKVIKKTWPELVEMLASTVTAIQCQSWGERLRKKYSPTRHNGTVDAMRAIFELAVSRGVRVDNPAAKVEKASLKAKELTLPSADQFHAILNYLDTFNKGRRKQGAVVVRFLAYTGMRTNEAGQVMPDMIDWERSQFNLPGRITKNGKPRHVPIIADLAPLLRRLLVDYKLEHRKGPLLPCRDPSKSLETCCKLAKAPRITNHDLRHLFITRCIESGVDVKTVAEWVGHSDGGALILKTYAHLRNEHSQAMAAKVSFAQPPQSDVIKLNQVK